MKDEMMPQEIEVYMFPTMNAWKVTIALEEMGLAYALKRVDIRKGEQYSAEFLKISPNNRVPAIVDPAGPDGQPISVFESGAILQYLGRKSGKFYPAEARQRVEVEEWLMWQMGGLGPMSGQLGHFLTYAPLLAEDPAQLAYGSTRYFNEVKRLYGVLDRRLNGREFLAAQYSIADMAVWPWIVGHRHLGFDLSDFPSTQAWFERVEMRPAVQAGKSAGRAFGIETNELSAEAKAKSLKALFAKSRPEIRPLKS
jgi:GST-like protein